VCLYSVRVCVLCVPFSLSRIITAVNTFDVAVGGCWCCWEQGWHAYRLHGGCREHSLETTLIRPALPPHLPPRSLASTHTLLLLNVMHDTTYAIISYVSNKEIRVPEIEFSQNNRSSPFLASIISAHGSRFHFSWDVFAYCKVNFFLWKFIIHDKRRGAICHSPEKLPSIPIPRWG
jgi:hypothetical protein